jgi:hypothetical protein
LRKLLSMISLLFIVFLTGCQTNQGIVIDWVDFVKWDGTMYDGIYSAVISDDKFIGKKIGEVKFRVSDNVSDPEYKVKNGDSAFHEKGTDIFAVKGYPYLIALKSSTPIHQYQLYYSREKTKYKWQYDDLPLEKVNKVEIYQAYTAEGNKRISEITKAEEVSRFIEILKNSKDSPNFEPNTEKGDPAYYKMVLYTGDPVAYMYDFMYDGQTFYWHPSETGILSNAMQTFIH